MEYSYILENDDRILRPVRVDDAEFIVKLRNQPHVIGRVNDSLTDVEKQREWIREYLKRENEYYWIMETLDHRPFGTTSLYHYCAEKRQMEIGRWVKMADAPQDGNQFASRIQMNDFVFDVLGMKRLVFDVVSTNKPVLKYHRLCGAIETGVAKDYFVIQGRPVDMVWFEETPESWKIVRPKLCRWAGIDPTVPFGKIAKVML